MARLGLAFLPMCGRKYSSKDLTWADYRESLMLIKPPQSNLQPHYNIAPSHIMPVAHYESGQHVLSPMQWGLIPTWAKDNSRRFNMANARAETLEEKASFKNLIKSCRCAVLVSGFYEWQRDGKIKQAHKVEHRDDKPMILAGLYAHNPYMETTTYTLITTPASPSFSAIHHRQPAILDKEDVAGWLHGPWREAKNLTRPYSGDIKATPISNDVGSVRNNHIGLLNSIS